MKKDSIGSRLGLWIAILTSALLLVILSYVLSGQVSRLSFFEFYTTLGIYDKIAFLILVPLCSLLVIYFFRTLSHRSESAEVYSVAVIGFPRSGKTTLITTLFLELKLALGDRFVPRGETTIERIYDDGERIRTGHAPRATRTQDVFSYRAEITADDLLQLYRYRVEVGDFPGEMSLEFADNYASTLHQSPYFSWVTSSNAFLYIVDTSELLCSDAPTATAEKIMKSLQAVHARLQDQHVEGDRNIRKMPVALVFTKVDLLPIFLSDESGKGWPNTPLPLPLRTQIKETAQGETIALKTPDRAEIKNYVSRITKLFEELELVLRQSTNRFELIAVSSVKSDNRMPPGILELAFAILPIPARRKLFQSKYARNSL